MKKLFFYIALLISFKLQSQNVDSLKNVVEKNISKIEQAKSLNELGSIYESKSDYKNALQHLYHSKSICIQNNFQNELVECYNLIGYVHWHKSNYDSALYYHNAALEITKSKNVNLENTSFTHLMLGNDYYDLGDFSKSSFYYFECLKIAEENNLDKIIIQCYNRLSKLFFKLNDIKGCLQYAQKSLQKNTNGFNRELAEAYNSMGNVSLSQNNLDSALYYFRKTFYNFRTSGDVIGQAIASINLGDTYQSVFDKEFSAASMDSSYFYYKHSYILNSKVDNKFGMIYGVWGMADVSLKKGQVKLALQEYESALKIANEIGAKSEVMELYNKIHTAFKMLQSEDSALHYLTKYVLLRNEIESSDKAKSLLKQESKYEAEKIISEQKNEFEKQRLIDKEKAKWKNIVVIISIVGILVLAYITFISIKRLRLIKHKNAIINEMNRQLNYQKNEILDSISYAKRIQSAILPHEDFLRKLLPKSFVLYLPKDIVAGDFYWAESVNEKIYFSVADCTGHGVPGAMMSLICKNELSYIINENNHLNTGKILDLVNEKIKNTLVNTGDDVVRDGMDIALCNIDFNSKTLEFSGAYISAYIVRNNQIISFKGDRQPIGKYHETNINFTTYKFELQKDDIIYLSTDGFLDQFGGAKNKKIGYRRFKDFILKISDLDIENQKTEMLKFLNEWKGTQEQVDDICVLVVKV